jgi:AcrR family transcriptional regulator
MAVEPRSRREEQSDATRRALLRVARRLFGRHGYAESSIDEIARSARVTHGALYHHFEGKQGLFRAVCEDVQQELSGRLTEAAQAEGRPERHLERGCEAFLDVCMEPDFQRIVLLDGPAVLGWEAWHEMDAQHGLGLLRGAIEAAMDAGYLKAQPVEPLAHVILGALNEAGHVIARADDPRAARKEMGSTVAALIDGLKR